MSEYPFDAYDLSPGVCHTQYYDGKSFKSFYHCEKWFFFEKFLSIDLLDPKELISSIATLLLKNLLNLYNSLIDNCQVWHYEIR